uniref:Chromosome 11 open reading frame 16 n=1 Tax=Athene cunicularia TaxID=194338 RepID=A0A663M4J8_ATHCN
MNWRKNYWDSGCSWLCCFIKLPTCLIAGCPHLLLPGMPGEPFICSTASGTSKLIMIRSLLCYERGMFLVEFAKPLVSCGRLPVCVQKTAKDNILEYVNGMKHSLLPGDKVLAPWEPDMARYGPGTVLMGIETRDPLRASEDEEIIVQFWNDKTVKLPRGVALWIPPSLWERIVEMIHMPFTSRVKPRETLIPVCAVRSLAKHHLLCSPCWPHFHYHCDGTCCLSAYVRCICCCHPRVDAWWPLPSRSLVFQSETEEAESSSKPSPCLLELKGPKQEAAAAVAASSPSSDSECDLEPFPTKSTVVDSAVNTGSSCLQKPRLKDSARLEWKYWKRSHHKSHPSDPGTF